MNKFKPGDKVTIDVYEAKKYIDERPFNSLPNGSTLGRARNVVFQIRRYHTAKKDDCRLENNEQFNCFGEFGKCIPERFLIPVKRKPITAASLL